MSMLATIQFVTGAHATEIPGGAVLVQMNLSSMPDGTGYGGAATLVLRTEAEANAMVDALIVARDLLASPRTEPVA